MELNIVPKSGGYKKTRKLKKKAIALLCRIPHEEHINFLKGLTTHYDIYFICDKDISDLNLPNIQYMYYIYYKDKFVADKGYKNSCMYINKNTESYGLVSSWDKAFFYFCNINTKYKNIWFVEDDVYIPLKSTLVNIDKKYSSIYDLLVESDRKSENGNFKEWGVSNLWEKMKNADYVLELPWYRSMQCINRVSYKLLNLIKELVENNNTLVFHEYMFNTLAHKNNLKVKVIPELKNVKWRYRNNNWNYDEIEFDKLYHPMKDMKLQQVYHEIMKKKDMLKRGIQTHQ